MNGVGLDTVGKELRGHRRWATTAIYAHLGAAGIGLGESARHATLAH